MSLDPYVEHHQGLAHVHGLLAEAYRGVLAATELSAMVQLARGAGGFLLAHHAVEDNALFPGIKRRARRLASTDLDFFARADRDHHELHTLCDRLLAEANAPHPAMVTLSGLARDTLALLVTHTREEEAGLAPERMRTLIDAEAFVEVGREVEAWRAQHIPQR